MRTHAFKLVSLLSLAMAVALFVPQRAAADQDDPPSRVARLSYTHGSVSFNPAGTDDWVNTVVNRPITTGDKLWTDNGARAELHIGSAAIRLSGNTGFSFLNLSDNVSQIRVTEGTINIRVRNLDDDETFEVDTPNLAFSILRAGRYRIDVNEAGDTTSVFVRDGEGEVTGGGSAYTIHPREAGTFFGNEQLDADVQRFRGDEDDFDHWCGDRDRREDRSISSRYVSRDVIGYEDLDDYGGWRPVPEYGNVWFPHTTVVGWAPYRYGHWVWISPWGWTWVDDEPWGFAPFHYGRWIVVRGVWGWVPCPPRPAVVEVAYVRPVYAPALVAWVGGPHFAVGIGVGGGGGVGVAWFPLGPREVYVPSYHVSRTYVNNVNVSNTTVNNTYVTNVYNTTVVNNTNNTNNVRISNIKYVNQGVPGAVTATSHETFTSAQPVGKHMIKVDERDVANAPVATAAAPVGAPPKQAVLGAGAPARVRPPAVLESRGVVAKTPPPPPPARFEQQQEAIRANGGRPIPVSEIRQQQRENAQVTPIPVKIAPPAKPGPPQNVPANRPGNMQNNAGNRPGAPGNVGQSQMKPANPPVVQDSAPPANQDVNKPGNKPGNSPANAGNPRIYNDRPPSVRPNNPGNAPGNVNPQLEQKHQQESEQLRQKQDQERQRIEQKQVQEQQKVQQDQERLRQRQDQERQRIEQQQQEQQRTQQKTADDRKQQQTQQRQQQQLEQMQRKQDQQQQQVQQKQQRQLEQVENKHGQEQQKLQQKQQQQQQKQQERPKDKQPDKPKDKEKDDKPHR